MSEEFKVGDRVEWCFGGEFDKYKNSNSKHFHDFGTITRICSDVIWVDFERHCGEDFDKVQFFRKAPDKEPKPPFRWLVTYFEAENEFAGDHSTNVYESAPVLQYWNGSEYVDAPVERIKR